MDADERRFRRYIKRIRILLVLGVVLAAETGLGNITVILSPVDLRERPVPHPEKPLPDWSRLARKMVFS